MASITPTTTEERSLRKLVLRAINFNTDATSIAHDIENLIADHQALIETEKREAYRQGGIDELNRACNHNNSEYTSDYLEDRIMKLTALTTKAEEGKK